MYERLHRLIGSAARLARSLSHGEALDFFDERLAGILRQQRGLVLAVAVVVSQDGIQTRLVMDALANGLGRILRVFKPAEQRQRLGDIACVLLAVRFCDALCHAVVKIGDALPAVLVVLVGLNGNAGERRIALNVVRLAQKAVACTETAVKQLFNIDLTAGGCQRQKIEVMDVDVAVKMRFGVDGIKHKHVVELLGALRAVFEHGAHGRVAVDIGVFALDIVFVG